MDVIVTFRIGSSVELKISGASSHVFQYLSLYKMLKQTEVVAASK
jgi:hypothetical protein